MPSESVARPGSVPGGPFVIWHPRVRNLGANHLRAAQPVWPLILASQIAFIIGAVRTPTLFYLLGLELLIVALAALPVTMSRVQLNGDVLTIVTPFQRRSVRRHDLARIRLCLIAHMSLKQSVRDVPNQKVLFVGGDGRCAAKVLGWFWSVSILRDIAAALDVPCDDRRVDVEAGELRRTVPGAVNWFEVHPTLAIGAGALALFVVGVVVVTVIGAVRG